MDDMGKVDWGFSASMEVEKLRQEVRILRAAVDKLIATVASLALLAHDHAPD